MQRNDRVTRIAYVIEAAFEYFISLFVTGTMLGYILDTLGFSDALQGIISTVATFTCGAQLFAIFLSGRRKRIVTIWHSINQLCFVLLYLFPIVNLPANVKSILLLILLFMGHILNNAINPSKITWLMESVPNRMRGRFTAWKEMISLAGGMIVSLVFGRIADIYRDADGMPTTPYYVICTAALLIMMLIHTATLIVSTEKEPIKCSNPSIKETLYRMAHNTRLIRVIGVGMLWNFASALSVSFFASYLREELAFSFTVIAAISTVGSLCRIAISPLLGKIADRYSFATSMTLSFAMAALAFLAVSFTTPQTRWLYLAYISLYSFSMAGINSGVINLIYDYVAPEDRQSAMGIKNAIGGILAFFTALASGTILAYIQSAGGLVLFGIRIYAQQILALLSCVVTLLLILYMRRVIAPMQRIDENTTK
jgi:MFS family permease